MQKRSIKGRPLNTFFTWSMAPWKFHGFIYAIILVTLAYASAVKGKKWYSLPYLPVTLTCVDIHHPSFLDFCPSSVLLVSILQSCSLITVSPYSFSIFLLNVDELELQRRGLKDNLQVTPLQSEKSGLKFFLQKLRLGLVTPGCNKVVSCIENHSSPLMMASLHCLLIVCVILGE